ncbi:MAG: hypothetical protein JW825_04040, partial [Candidatus Methanofastidiosa archaeon]|nr:hypothetical protein [Candidatus Methanofastidiosa archaeon]
NDTDMKFKDPLIVIDPVDHKRNVASPISLNTFSRFVLSCRTYLDNDDVNMFFGPERGYVRVDGGRLVVIELLYDAFEDIFYAQCRRFMKAIEKACKAEGFTIFNCGAFSKGLFFDFEISKLPICLKYRGPALGNIENMTKFILKNDDVFAEDGHLYVIKRRKHSDVIDLINDIINDKIGMGEQLKKANIKILLDNEAHNALKNEIVYF